jgi:3-oxoadipate enol-lactonase
MKHHQINGINVLEHGEDNKQPVVFVHAFPLSLRMWDPQTEALKNDYRVIVYDNRSFGYSDVDTDSLTIDSHVDDLFGIIEKLNLDKPILCGLSMGGYIALRALERNQDIFKAVILSDTRSFADDNSGKIKRAEQIRQIKRGGRKVFDEEFLKNALSPKTLDGDEEKKKIVGFIKEIMNNQKSSSVTEALLTMAARTDTTDSLENINLPALIIVGEDDKLTPASPSRLMNAKIKNAKLIIIPEAGHFPNLENTAKFNEEIIKFLKALN